MWHSILVGVHAPVVADLDDPVLCVLPDETVPLLFVAPRFERYALGIETSHRPAPYDIGSRPPVRLAWHIVQNICSGVKCKSTPTVPIGRMVAHLQDSTTGDSDSSCTCFRNEGIKKTNRSFLGGYAIASRPIEEML
jgi:hypothetical protein